MSRAPLAARVLFPELPPAGAGTAAPEVLGALRLGVGGFLVRGGPADAVRDQIREVRERRREPLLMAAELERGAGARFPGCTRLPPAWALGALGDLELLWRAGELTGREARALGIDWVLAPVADLGNDPSNPAVATRAFGTDPEAVARAVVAWSLGCLAGGALPCVKHFPGRGRGVSPAAEAPEGGLERAAKELVPFAAAAAAGVPSLMGAGAAYLGLDPEPRPAWASLRGLDGLLRRRLGFRGVAAADLAPLPPGQEERRAVEAARAGIDAFLCPRDPGAVARALAEASRRVLPPRRLGQAVRRLVWLRKRLPALPRAAVGPRGAAWEQPSRGEDERWARQTALRCVSLLRDPAGVLGGPFSLVLVDDDLGGPEPAPAREPFQRVLLELGADVEEAVGSGDTPPPGATRLIAVYAQVEPWKRRVGLSPQAQAKLRQALGAPGPALVVLFSHPWNAVDIPPSVPVVCAWAGDELMQEAAARTLMGLKTRG